MPGEKYDHQSIEKKWQKRWADEKIFSVSNTASNGQYVLDMFPYPSGDGLHVGHPEGYTASDIFSRYARMKGKPVLHPMGWDAFGLPAENAAIKKNTHPRIVTEQNIKNFKRQIQAIGFSYDWDREINTTDPKYYRWTQWIFLQLFKRGLAYEKEAPIWWCPKDKTGLANEEVVNGCCERCGTPVEKKMLKQWMLKITAYADRLLDGLEPLDWPEGIKTLQRNWIGRSEGAEVVFTIQLPDQVRHDKKQNNVTVFTTRPDTLFGATYLVLSPEHPLVDEIVTAEQKTVAAKYVKAVAVKSDLERTSLEKEKTGVFTGAYAVNPVNNEKIPVWIADYVLMSYGTGAIMAVPGHDQRDYDFAKKFKLPIREVVVPYRYYHPNPPRPGKKTVERRNVHAIVTNPKTGKILGLKWTKHPWTTFPMGGIDDGEDIIAAAKREVLEETGYTDLKFERVLGGQVKAEYFAAHKDENRISYTQAVVFSLASEKQTKVAEAELAAHEILWLDPSKMAPEHMVHAELDVWLSRLKKDEPVYVGEGALINSGQFNAEMSELGRRKIVEWLAQHGQAQEKIQYKLRDWVFSRQRYWGEPIPVVHCDNCKQIVESSPHHIELKTADEWQAWVDNQQTITNAKLAKEVSTDHTHQNHYVKVSFGTTVGYWRVKQVKKNQLTLKHVWPGIILVPEKELPLVLPPVEQYQPTGTGESPLAGINEWVNVTCRVCGHPAKRETNTMPQWAGSCWYYLRFTDPDNDEAFASKKSMQTWLPVDLYVGGAEHAVLHLLYSRFWHMVLYDIGAVPAKNDQGESLAEPFTKLKNQGLILGPDGEKMSKSRGNVINPDEIIEKYGADTLRMYEMFMGPFEDAKPWDTNGIVGVRRFLDRVWRVTNAIIDSKLKIEGDSNHKDLAVKKITEAIQKFRFNTAISDLMIFFDGPNSNPDWRPKLNSKGVLEGESYDLKALKIFLKLLNPFAPHISEELWLRLGNKELLAQAHWPELVALRAEASVTIVIQVNGTLRATITQPTGTIQTKVEEAAKAESNVTKFLTAEPKKVIFVKDKLINFVV